VPGNVSIVIDSDGGVDDAAALWWAATDPRVDLVAVTSVWGNVDVATAARNICTVLHAAGRPEIPVAVGLGEPIGPAPEIRRADFIHGTDGLGDAGHRPGPTVPVDEPADAMLARLAAERPGELTLVTVGPMSNIGARLAADPAWASAWRRLVVMGGVAAAAGNATPAAEANIGHDPVAADRAARAAWRRPPLLIGLDVTHRATLTDVEYALLAERRNPAAAFLDGPLRFYRPFGGTFCAEGESPCHDLLAVMAAVLDDLVDAPELPLAVQADPGPAWGRTVVDLRELAFRRRGGDQAQQPTPPGFAPWNVGLDVDVARFRAEVRRLFGEGQPA